MRVSFPPDQEASAIRGSHAGEAKDIRSGVPRGGAVRIVGETGKPIAQVARDLGINEGTLGNWVASGRAGRGEAEGLCRASALSSFSCAARMPSSGWSAMSSSEGWSSG